jgi:hypothetical protein
LPRLRIAEKGEQGGGDDGDMPIAHGRPTFHHPRIRAPTHLNTKLFFAAIATATTALTRRTSCRASIIHSLGPFQSPALLIAVSHRE